VKSSGHAAAAPTAAGRSLARRAGALAVGALTLSGCATAVLGVHEPFQIVSSPAGAHVSLSTGETCVTPCTLELPRSVAFQARVSLPGYVTQVIPVASRTSAGGAVGFLGNGMVGGLIGASVDIDSGAMRSLFPNPLRVRLSPLPPQTSAQNH
jgi:hypothetical protein